jgi:phage baseplate assembly protein W
MAVEERTFSDLDLNFTKHPITKDVARKTGNNAIIGALKNLVYTNFYERPFNPKFGSNVRGMLFEPLDPLTGSILQKEIKILIENYEPRVSLRDIQVVADYDRNSYQVTITFFTVNSTQPLRTVLFLNRLR